MPTEHIKEDRSPDTNAVDHAPQPSGAEDAERESFFTRDVLRHNIWVMITFQAFLMTGSEILSVGQQPLFNYLTNKYETMGKIQGLTGLGIIGTVLTPYLTRLFPFKKWYYITTVTMWALAIMGLGFALIFSNPPPTASPDSDLLRPLLYVTMVSMTLFNLIGGFTSLPHNEFVASCIPSSHRGRMWGTATVPYAVLAIIITLMSGRALTIMKPPASYGLIFILSGLTWLVGFIFAALNKEKRSAIEGYAKPWRLEMFKAFWRDKRYVRYTIFSCLATLTFFPVFGMIPNFGMKELGMPDKIAVNLKLIGLLLIIPTSVPTGWLIDRFTPKRIIPIGMFLVGIGFLYLRFNFTPLGIYISAVFIRILGSAIFPSMTIMSISIPKPEDRAGHFAIAAVIGIGINAIGARITGYFSDLLTPQKVILYTGIGCILFYPLSKYMFRILGDKMDSYH